MARSLVQALEGIDFPCDRSKLMEYARTNDAAAKALDSLAAIPERQYANMTEVLTAVPSKTGRYRSAGMAPQPQPRAQPQSQPRQPEPEPAPPPQPDLGEVAPAPQAIGLPFWNLGWEWTQAYIQMAQRVWFPWLR